MCEQRTGPGGLARPQVSHNDLVGPYRFSSEQDPEPPLMRIGIDQVRELAGVPVEMIMTPGDHESEYQIYDNVILHNPTLLGQSGDRGMFLFELHQILLPGTPRGWCVPLEIQYDGLHFGGSMLHIARTEHYTPIRRLYEPAELYRYVGYGARLVVLHCPPGQPMEAARLHRDVTIDMANESATQVSLAKVLEIRERDNGLPEPVRTRPIGTVPVEEIAFAMQIQH